MEAAFNIEVQVKKVLSPRHTRIKMTALPFLLVMT